MSTKNGKWQVLARMWRNWNPYKSTDGNVKWYSRCGKQFGGSLQKRINIWSSNSALSYNTQKEFKRGTRIHVWQCSLQHYSQQSTGGNNSGVHPSTDEWKNKIRYVHPSNGKLFIYKMNEVLKHATTWMDLENSMLGEKPDRITITWFHLCEILDKSNA